MIKKYTQLLEDIKAGKIKLSEFLYEERIDENGYSDDKNAIRRFQLLIALQYNPSLRDEEMLVQLFKAEIENHRKATFQGVYPALSLNAFLLSQYANPKYAELFLKAKQANFDTHCGFEYQFLVSAGIPETYQFIKQAEPNVKDAFYEYVGMSANTCYISETELEKWKEYLAEVYPDELIINGILDEIQLAIDLDETDILKQKVKEWYHSKSSWSKDELNNLVYFTKIIQDVSTQIWANEELLKFKSSDWDFACQLLYISELLIQQNFYDQAWKRIKEAHQYLERISEWNTAGLGRDLVECSFDIVLGVDDKNNSIAKEAFQWASDNVKQMENLHLDLLEKIIQAGNLMGDSGLNHQFSEILEKERKELDKLMNRK
ncbi:hypothetical protein LVD15_22565 [Fulvivirga maritima]|uniref:hypothetical protein n=1 Tax=Fulvivirga maritima TaxID=2904247 RepID=UPI001F244FBA|nr:hypothetical protein [Fulvivirga maritima]UII26059.1 hypothetical protein LVD15_22565 [Fulvivirga maritima]